MMRSKEESLTKQTGLIEMNPGREVYTEPVMEMLFIENGDIVTESEIWSPLY